MPKLRTMLTEERDVPMLLFIWRWKITTTSALHAKFFPKCTLASAYRRLWDIEAAGYLSSVLCPGMPGRLWELSRRGFLAIKERLPLLREVGFKSECLYHDLLCGALQLGDWIRGTPEAMALFSEQQLRRYDVQTFPTWVPKAQGHRPDGYTFLTGEQGSRVIALEVELSAKTPAAYGSLAGFYLHNRPAITQVLWLVSRASFAPHLKGHLARYDAEAAATQHDFVALPDFLKLGWQAPVILGPSNGELLADLMAPQKGPRKAPEICGAT